MECLSPLSIRVDAGNDYYYQHVPCGKCYQCVLNRRNDWTFRIKKETEKAYSGAFLTMTYNEEELPMVKEEKVIRKGEIKNEEGYISTLYKRDLQNWIKRVRKVEEKDKSRKLRYYAVGEYGDKLGRPHYHMIIWNFSLQQEKAFQEKWEHGFLDFGFISDASIHYTTGYVMNKVNNVEGRAKVFAIMSKGIGRNYIVENANYHNNDKYGNTRFQVSNDGHKMRMPRYYRDMVMSAAAREEYADDMVKRMADKDEEYINDCKKKGLDPWKYKVEQIENRRKILNRNKKNRKL